MAASSAFFRPALGDVVHLVAECRSEWTGRIYEIGTEARVVAARGALLGLEVGPPADADRLHCSPSQVSHAPTRGRRPLAPWGRRRVLAA